MREDLILLYANNKGAIQPVHMSSLISAYVIRPHESIIVKFANMQIFYALYVAGDAGLNST